MYRPILAIAAALILTSCAADAPEPPPPPEPESTVEKIEDEAKRLLDDIERKPGKE